MSWAIKLHTVIEKFNPLNELTQDITKFLLVHPTLYKIALVVNHIFRAVTMAFFMHVLPFSLPVSGALCFGASLFYRLTVENNCAYKFALPAFIGGMTLPTARFGFAQLINSVALKNLAFFSHSIVFLMPVAVYLTYVVLTVDYDVNQRCH